MPYWPIHGPGYYLRTHPLGSQWVTHGLHQGLPRGELSSFLRDDLSAAPLFHNGRMGQIGGALAGETASYLERGEKTGITDQKKDKEDNDHETMQPFVP